MSEAVVSPATCIIKLWGLPLIKSKTNGTKVRSDERTTRTLLRRRTKAGHASARLACHQSFPSSLTSNKSHLKVWSRSVSRAGNALWNNVPLMTLRAISPDDGIFRLKSGASRCVLFTSAAAKGHAPFRVSREGRGKTAVREISPSNRRARLNILRADPREIIGTR